MRYPWRSGRLLISRTISRASRGVRGTRAKGHVLQYLDEDSAKPEQDDVAELGVLVGANDDLDPGVGHLLHRNAQDVGGGHSFLAWRPG